MEFRNTYDDAAYAAAYAKLEFSGTYHEFRIYSAARSRRASRRAPTCCPRSDQSAGSATLWRLR